VLSFDEILGLGVAKWREDVVVPPDGVRALIEQRSAARARKEWDESDRLRDEIRALGYSIEDKGSEQIVRKG